ncbi:MAG: hypothetical protein FGM43_01325 [Sinobacteraceae bacterium]|nr:hypothetical protein [Nevskiaceae bacterium]
MTDIANYLTVTAPTDFIIYEKTKISGLATSVPYRVTSGCLGVGSATSSRLTTRAEQLKCQFALESIQSGVEMNLEDFVDSSFVDLVETRWASLARGNFSVKLSTVVSRRTADQLALDIRSETATARIDARAALRTLHITVSRFKDERVLSEGACNTEIDLDRKLRSLLIDLST